MRSCVISISGAGTVHTIYSIIRGAMSHMRKSELSKWGLNELCCKRTVHRWNRLELRFPLMYGTGIPHSTQKLSLWGALTSTVPWASVLRGCGRPFPGRFSSRPRNGYGRLERFRRHSTPDFCAQRWPPFDTGHKALCPVSIRKKVI